MEISFNNREIAGLLWLAFAIVTLLIYATRNDRLRSSIGSIFRATLNYKLLVTFIIPPSIGITVAILYSWLELLSFSVIKAIFLWAIIAGFGLLFKAIQTDQRVTTAAVGKLALLSLALEYIASYGRFSLPVELILLPILFILGLMTSAKSFTRTKDEDDQKYEIVERFCTVVLSLAGLFLLSAGAVYLLCSPDAPPPRIIVAELSVPIIATIIALPAMIFLEIWAWYEEKLVRLRYSITDPDLRKYAFWSAMCTINVNRELAKVWLKLIDEERPTNFDEIDKIMRSSVGIWLDSKTRRPINSPRATFKELEQRLSEADWTFFSEAGLREKRFLNSHTKQWDTYPNHASLNLDIEGPNSLVETIVVRMTSWKKQDLEQDIERFTEETNNVLSLVSYSDFNQTLSDGEEISINGIKLRLEHQRNDNGLAPFTELELKIDLTEYDYSKVRLASAQDPKQS